MIEPTIKLNPAEGKTILTPAVKKDSIEEIIRTTFEAPIPYLLVKLASRCNFACRYCYWFRDEDVYRRPPLLTLEAESAWLICLERHLSRFSLREFPSLTSWWGAIVVWV